MTNLLAFASTPLSKDRPDNVSQNSPQLEPSVASVARQVTVRIFTSPGAGSGVIIDRQGQTYTVLTCAHVANASGNGSYRVLTPDGQTHLAFRQRIPALQGIDLALVRFESQTPYRVAVLGNFEEISIGEPVYISGFPNYQERDTNALEVTYDWGTKAFHLTTGNISMLLLDRSLHRGYKLGYTNATKGGMSGGAVLDRQGRLIGIHGRGKQTIQGISAFRLADGTMPSPELYEQMSGLSWAIPIYSFQQRMGQLPVLPIRNNLKVPPAYEVERPGITPTMEPKI
ncbi:serine protease [Microcoleus vaginatus DQ-U2]|uniref:S1 family peptidase n=1 Tax=Microcoleus vaginatus TaxID=119532 RepID=UPI0018EFF45C